MREMGRRWTRQICLAAWMGYRAGEQDRLVSKIKSLLNHVVITNFLFLHILIDLARLLELL